MNKVISFFLTIIGIAVAIPTCSYTQFCVGNTYCHIPYGEINGTCICDNSYATLSHGTYCGYKRKSSLVGLLLTIFLDAFAPAGRLYASAGLSNVDSTAEIITLCQLLTSGVVGTCVFFALFSLSVATESIHAATSTFIALTTFIWWVVNIVLFAEEKVYDENGVRLVFA